MTAGIYQGATSVLLARFDPEIVFEVMQKESITIFAGVPTMYWGLLHCPLYLDFEIFQDLPGERGPTRSTCSQVVGDSIHVPILEGYGMSEGSGKPVWGVEVDLFDENDKPVTQGEKASWFTGDTM